MKFQGEKITTTTTTFSSKDGDIVHSVFATFSKSFFLYQTTNFNLQELWKRLTMKKTSVLRGQKSWC